MLINNAGIIRRGDSLDFTEKDWDDVIDMNLKAVFFRRATTRLHPGAAAAADHGTSPAGRPRRGCQQSSRLAVAARQLGFLLCPARLVPVWARVQRDATLARAPGSIRSNRTTMRLGIFSNGQRHHQIAADSYEQDLRELIAADELGYDEAWISEYVGVHRIDTQPRRSCSSPPPRSAPRVSGRGLAQGAPARS